MTLSFAFGGAAGEAGGALGMGLPLLGGEPSEVLLHGAEPVGGSGGLSVWRGPDGLAGCVRAAPGADLERVTRRIYAQVLRATRGLSLYRMWNVVPRINADDPTGLENYRVFCRGRSLAFESALGGHFARGLPASTAVGAPGPELTVVFLAGARPARHFENPAQVPAYEYPPEHGPRSPSFARATVVDRAGPPDVLISGTSSIVGHATVAPHDTSGQLACTIENLRLISKACGLGDGIGAGRRRHLKVYHRKPGDRPEVARQLARTLLAAGDRVTYLGAEICRAALNVEIEVALRGDDRT
jgi:hypothetical protein